MRKIATTLKLAVVGMALMFSTASTAQIDVKMNILGMAFNQYQVGGEYILSEEMSAGLTISYAINKVTVSTGDGLGDIDEERKFTGFQMVPAFRFYFNPDHDCEGFYAEPHFRFMQRGAKGLDWYTYDSTGLQSKITYDRKTTAFGAGISFGKKWVTDAGFFFGTGFGIGKNFVKNTTWSDPTVTAWHEENNFDLGINIYLRLALNIGWRFG